jgi:hypothetical protein
MTFSVIEKNFLIEFILNYTMGENHRGFDEPNRKQRQRRRKRVQREGFEPPNP